MAARETIVLGGGCFWCTEAVFVRVRGVLDVESGYCNGQAERPSYEDVCTGDTGCVEVVRLEFDPAVISLEQILSIFFAIHDPTQLNRQGHDLGTQYRSGIYCSDERQLAVARDFIAGLEREQVFARPIVTEVRPLAHYWPARTTTRTSSSAIRTRATAWRWLRPRSPSCAPPSPTGCGTDAGGAGAAAGRRRAGAITDCP